MFKRKERSQAERSADWLVILANWVIRVIGAAIFLVLVWYAFRYTQYMVPMQGYEYPVDKGDSEIANLLTMFLFMGLIAGLMFADKKATTRVKNIIKHVSLVISMLWQGVWGYLWISAADRCPKGDQESVFKSAAGFFSGDYHALSKGSYCGLYPHQLGLAALEEGIFRIIGRADYHVLQFLFVLMIAGICFCVYKILSELTEQTAVVVAGTVLGGSCMAPVFYSCWVYGEVPYVFFALLAIWFLVCYVKREKWWYLALFTVSVTFAMLVRENALILIVAFALAAGVRVWAKRDYKLLVTVLCAFLIPALAYEGIFVMYEARSGYEHSDGLPSNDFVYVGLQETVGRYGWDYYKSSQIFYDNGKDTKKTEEAVSELIAERWREMRETPGYLKTFYKGKILSQWNAPLYQSLYFNYVHEDVHYPGVTEFFDSLSGARFEKVLWVADRLQFLLYVGVLCYFVFAVRGDSEPLQHVAAITIIGGFLFSILWEAKTRYIFPYYMMMFPVAMIGYQEMIIVCRKLFATVRRKMSRRSDAGEE